VQQLRFHILSHRCALSPLSPLRPFAFAPFCFPSPQSPWPRWFIPSISRTRGHSTWFATCSDRAHRRSPKESVPAPLPSAISPPGSSCSSLLPLLRVGVADPAILPAVAGGARPSASAPHAPLHPPGGHLHPPMRDVHGGGAMYLPLPPFFRAGEVREGHEPPRRVLLPDEAGLG
jgi:hypothetical protein